MIQWRIDNNVDSILEDAPTLSRMDLLRKVLPGAPHGYTKAHRPLYIKKSGLIRVMKHWFDPVTKAKIVVIKKGSGTSTLLLQHIDSDQLPHEYGGSCNSCSTAPNCIPVYDWGKDTADDEQEE
ncbi:unnamed protein product [Rotaria sordida]|nr:unnamed protein product [Rotaria sordida]CAF3989360.1 unnamed protein product [Rotaria sordida]